MASLVLSTPLPSIPGPNGPRLPFLTGEWHRARTYLRMPNAHTVTEIYIAGKPIAEARCEVAHKALELGARFLFFLDWDILPPQNALCKLVDLAENRPEYDIFSAMCCTRTDPPEPIYYREWLNGVSYDWTVGEQIECVGFGAGCMLIRVEALQRIPEPWFEMQTECSEDILFCKQAEKVGVKALMDASILCSHIDPATGVTYSLPLDILPWRRFMERHKQAQQESE